MVIMTLKWKTTFVVFLWLGYTSAAGVSPGVQCLENYKCVPLSQCHLKDSESFIYPCHSGLNLICCPPGSFNSSTATVVEARKTTLFPINCGLVLSADKITGGKKADLGQFPWMALLGYKQRQIEIVQFLCGGSVITKSYVLTAAHCIYLDRRLELVVARLGEQNLLTDIDCVEIDKTKHCADRYVDHLIGAVIPHPDYKSDKLENDIALVKVQLKIEFTEYVMPICLPFERKLELLDLTGQKFTVSGWGKTSASNLGGSSVLQYTRVKVWNSSQCNKLLPPEVKPIQDTQLCANGAKDEDACKGDSGGPLVNATVDADGESRYFQIGIVSFASSLTCGNPTLPTVYTRLDKYLTWILENVS